MAARSVRILFSNLTDQPLKFVTDGHSSGQFTDPWYPPPIIHAQAIAEWRSESDGIFTGAVGSATYEIGSPNSLIQIDWDNPYVGFNSCNLSVSDKFSTNPVPKSVIDQEFHILTGSLPNARLEFEPFLDTFLFAPYLIANASSYDDTTAFFGIRTPPAQPDPPSPIFKDSGATAPQSLKLNRDANVADWAGDWDGDGIIVTLTNLGKGQMMHALITDRAGNPAFQFGQDFELGVLSAVGRQEVGLALSTDFSGGSAPLRDIFLTASTHALNRQNTHFAAGVAENFRKVVTGMAVTTGAVRIGDQRVHQASAAVSGAVISARSTVLLMHGVSLTLYDEFEGSVKRSKVLNYQRLDARGTVLFSASLRKRIEIR